MNQADNTEKLRVIAEWMGWAKARWVDGYDFDGYNNICYGAIRDGLPHCYAALLPAWHRVRDTTVRGLNDHRKQGFDCNCINALANGSIQDLTNALFSAINFLNSLKK